MKLKQGYIFHNANDIPSSSLLCKEEWFGRSLEERRPNNSFVALPWKYKHRAPPASTDSSHSQLKSTTEHKMQQTQVTAELQPPF